MDGSVLGKNHLSRSWGCFSFLNWIGSLSLSLLLKLPPRKLDPLFVLWNFFLLRLLFIFINLPYSIAWNTAIWKCWIIYKNRYLELLVPLLLLLLNIWLIAKIEPVYVFSVGITLLDVHLNWLNCFHFFILERGQLVILMGCIISVSPFLDVIRMSISTSSLLI